MKVEATGAGGGKSDGRHEPELEHPEPAQDTLKQAKSNSNQDLEVENEQWHNEDKDVEEDDDEDRDLEAEEEEGEEKKKDDSGKSSESDDEFDEDEEDTDDEDHLIAMASPLANIKDMDITPQELLIIRLRDIFHKYMIELDAKFETWLSDDVSNLAGKSFEWSDVSDDEDSDGPCWPVLLGEEADVPDAGTTADIESTKEDFQSLMQQGRHADALRYCLNVKKHRDMTRRPGKWCGNDFKIDASLQANNLLKSLNNLLNSSEAAAQPDPDLLSRFKGA